MPLAVATLALAALLGVGTVTPRRAPGAAPTDSREAARAFDRGDYRRAIELARARLQARPRDVEAHIVLARAEAALGRFEAAYEGFRNALRIDPRSTDALYYLGITSGALAQAEYERLFALAPDSARAHQVLGESYEAQERPAEAEAEYETALEKSPKSVDVLVALGDLARSKSNFDNALGYYSRAAAVTPRHYDVLYGIGVCHSYRGQQALAIQAFREALRLEPNSAPAHLALGISLLQTGETQAAIGELEAATALEPRMRQAYYQLGRAHQLLGRSAEADAAFAKVQELMRQERAAAEEGLKEP